MMTIKGEWPYYLAHISIFENKKSGRWVVCIWPILPTRSTSDVKRTNIPEEQPTQQNNPNNFAPIHNSTVQNKCQWLHFHHKSMGQWKCSLWKCQYVLFAPNFSQLDLLSRLYIYIFLFVCLAISHLLKSCRELSDDGSFHVCW